MFNLEKVHYILDEMIMNGTVYEINKDHIVEQLSLMKIQPLRQNDKVSFLSLFLIQIVSVVIFNVSSFYCSIFFIPFVLFRFNTTPIHPITLAYLCCFLFWNTEGSFFLRSHRGPEPQYLKDPPTEFCIVPRGSQILEASKDPFWTTRWSEWSLWTKDWKEIGIFTWLKR